MSLESVLGMYSVPSSPLWRGISSGILTACALKVAGSAAEHASKIGWHTILFQAGEKKSGVEITKELVKQGFTSVEILVVLKCLTTNQRCNKCKGSGKVWSLRGHRFKNCDSCEATGKRKLPYKSLCEKHGADESNVERAIHLCLVGQSEAERAIKQFLRKERNDLQ